MSDESSLERKGKVKQTRNAADTRVKILKAARYEFALHGFAGARTERIVSRAKSNPRMLYHYFGGKAGLYVAVLEEALGDLRHEELKIDVEHLSPIVGLMQLFEFMHKHFEGNRDFVRLLSNENIQKARYLKTSKRVTAMSSPVVNTIAQLLERGAAAGTVRDDADPLQVYVMMVALNQFHLSNVYTLSVIFAQNLDTPQWRAKQYDAAKAMMRAFLQPQKIGS